MKINIIYNTKTGNILQIHTGIESEAQIMDRFNKTGKIKDVSLLTLDKLPNEVSSFKVNIKTGKLVKSSSSENVSFGASSFEPMDEKKYAKIVKEAKKLLVQNNTKPSSKKKK